MPLSNLVYIVASCAFLPILVAFGIGVLRFRVATSHERLLIVLAGVALVAEISSSALWRNQMNNLFISHLYVPIELVLLLSYFSVQFEGILRRLIVRVAIGFVGFSIVDSVFFHSVLEMNDLSRTLECVLLITVSLLTWGRIMKRMEVTRLTHLPLFWVNAAVLVYFSAITLLFVFSRSILSASSELGIWVWSVHLFFMSVYYALFSIGLWKIRRKATSHN